MAASALVSASAMVPAFIARTAQFAAAQDNVSVGKPIPGFKDDRVLVIGLLDGGNDGLNTLPPFHDVYFRSRPNLAHARRDIVKIASDVDDFGFAPAAASLKPLYDTGKLAIIPGVGYPNPNRSHFRSMEIWHTASDAEKYEYEGWLGRYLANSAGADALPTASVSIGAKMHQAFDGAPDLGVSFYEPDSFKFQIGYGGDTETAWRAINRLDKPPTEIASNLDFVRRVSANLGDASRAVVAVGDEPAGDGYPNGAQSQLARVAAMIAAGLPTRIYFVSVGGFDTHANQAGTHQYLITQVTQTLAAFQADLERRGIADRVLTMVFSEFGRRLESNASNGTDHGTAGPMFLVGNSVKPGVHGRHPSLTDLDDTGDMKFTTDFRRVYASVLKSWFKADVPTVLRRDFAPLDLLK